MILELEFKEFIEYILNQKDLEKDVFYQQKGDRLVLTINGKKKDCVVRCNTGFNLQEIEIEFADLGFRLRKGRWFYADEVKGVDLGYWLTVISYPTTKDTPGIWVDMSYEKPTTQKALKKMYEEFVHSGDLSEISFDDFNSHPGFHVMFLPSSALKRLLEKNDEGV